MSHPHGDAIGGLLCGLDLQGRPGKVEQWHVALSGPGLDRSEDQAALDALELLADLYRARAEIDVSPAQAEALGPAHAVEDEQDERRVHRISLCSTEELPGLVSGPRAGWRRAAIAVARLGGRRRAVSVPRPLPW